MDSTNSSQLDVNATENPSASSLACFVSDSAGIKVTRILVYCVIMVVSLVGNTLVIYIVAKDRRMQKTVNFFILNMAVADILITLYMPRVVTLAYAGYAWQVGGPTGLAFCKLAVFFHETAIAVANFTVVAISLDRFFAVVFPLKVFITKRVCTGVITVIWLLAVALRIPMAYGVKTVMVNGELRCSLNLDAIFGPGTEKAYYYLTLVGLFSVPLVIIVGLYSAIFVSIRKRKTPGDRLAPMSEPARDRKREMRARVLRMVTAVVAAFVMCWLLYFIELILFAYKIPVSCNVRFMKFLLAHFNSALNPCLYVTFSENFRKNFRALLAGLPCCKYAMATPVDSLNPSTGNELQTLRPNAWTAACWDAK